MNHSCPTCGDPCICRTGPSGDPIFVKAIGCTHCPVNSCGYICFPASNPGDGSASYDCAHAKERHYDIDGENVGCVKCEEIAEAPIGYHPDYEWREGSGDESKPDDPLTLQERREIESQLVGTLFPLSDDEGQHRVKP